MSIPVSEIVNVSITIGATFPERRGFGILNCVTAELGVIGFAERIRFYSNADAVAADWPSMSEVVALANAYFSQQPKPTEFAVSVRADSAVAAELRGGSVVDDATNLALFVAIADGSFNVSIDGDAQDITGLDFTTGVTDLSDVAGVVQSGLQAVATGGYAAATCTYDGQRFYIHSGTTGATSTITFLTAAASGTDIGSLLQMKQGEGTRTNGIDPETITAALDAIQQVNPNWYGLIFTKEVRDAKEVNSEPAVMAAATWIQARVKTFFNTSNDLDVLDSVITTDIVSQLNDANMTRTMSTFSSYPNQYPGASIAGRAFTVQFSQPNSTITLKFKQLPGINVEDLTSNEKSVLDAKRGNAFIRAGGLNIYAESFMAGDNFFDEVHGIDWLTDAIQISVYGYLATRATKVPYTDAGVAALEQRVVQVLDEGVRNGLMAPGETIDGEFLPRGYKTTTIPVADVSDSEKQNRVYNGLSFIALGAGAIHSVQIQGVFER